jgi:hypothetical protein
MTIADDLRKLGWKPEQIAAATINGKPLSEAEPKSRTPDGMNKTEALFAAELDWQKREGIVVEWKFESIKLRLARKTHYTPDFFVRYSDGRLVFIEIKGFLRDDSAIKFKLAREAYPWAEFRMLRRREGAWHAVNI